MTLSNEVHLSVSCNNCGFERKLSFYDVIIHGQILGLDEFDLEDAVSNEGWIWLSMDEQYCSESCNREAHEPEPEETLSAAERNPGLCNRR